MEYTKTEGGEKWREKEKERFGEEQFPGHDAKTWAATLSLFIGILTDYIYVI